VATVLILMLFFSYNTQEIYLYIVTNRIFVPVYEIFNNYIRFTRTTKSEVLKRATKI